MSFLTKKQLSRRTVLKGMGVTMALPFLDAMVPARAVGAPLLAARKIRLVAVEMVHGSAGSSADRHQEEPLGAGGRRPRLRSVADQPVVARAVSRPPDHRQQHRRAQRRGVHRAGNRRRSFPLERRCSSRRCIRSRRRAPTCRPGPRSTSMYAQRFGQDTPIPSMQLCIENVDQAGGCSLRLFVRLYRFDQLGVARDRSRCRWCATRASVFDQLFGVGRDAGPSARSGAPKTAASSTG